MSVAPKERKNRGTSGVERVLALTAWRWAGGGRVWTQGPRHSGGPEQGHSPHSSHRHYSWLGEPLRDLLRSLQTVHPARAMESVRVLPAHLPRPQHLRPAPE